ncbi:MAG TPA: TIGR03668 family PPOX class F420-dependent oxidoreductase [Blastocatellia bacterium]|nr:TIGR03668 family PPOX class F420-dependent oxidoreductase [Blastocatellia bacterium]
MALPIDNRTAEFIRNHAVARLATADSEGQPSVVPVCYAFDGAAFYTPIDEKPKSVNGRELRRVRNIAANRRVSLLIDDYSDDWSKLAYVVIRGLAEVLEPQSAAEEHAHAVALLREKYPQYREMAIDRSLLIKIMPVRIKRWGA